MADDEDQLAASALSNILTSAMFRAYDGNRKYLYVWERDGYSWLLRFKERKPDSILCAWSTSFMYLNRDAILAAGGPLDFNLRAARLAEQKIED